MTYLSADRGRLGLGPKAPLVPDEGIEPPTFGLQNRCTTAVLIRPDAGAFATSAERRRQEVQPTVALQGPSTR